MHQVLVASAAVLLVLGATAKAGASADALVGADGAVAAGWEATAVELSPFAPGLNRSDRSVRKPPRATTAATTPSHFLLGTNTAESAQGQPITQTYQRGDSESKTPS
jgi:hypothetical protein